MKWQNRHADGSDVHDGKFMDTDIPLFRLAEIYLTRAEANYRLGNTSDALADIQTIQKRAHRVEISGAVDEQTLIDEWCREFYVEGRRRSDLIRFWPLHWFQVSLGLQGRCSRRYRYRV